MFSVLRLRGDKSLESLTIASHQPATLSRLHNPTVLVTVIFVIFKFWFALYYSIFDLSIVFLIFLKSNNVLDLLKIITELTQHEIKPYRVVIYKSNNSCTLKVQELFSYISKFIMFPAPMIIRRSPSESLPFMYSAILSKSPTYLPQGVAAASCSEVIPKRFFSRAA